VLLHRHLLYFLEKVDHYHQVDLEVDLLEAYYLLYLLNFLDLMDHIFHFLRHRIHLLLQNLLLIRHLQQHHHLLK
jgi:hypothetical protein|tara:strand:- start:91 stop:315 length:225 start_codon:yes stop_codon:yes gene_type:complete